MSEDAINFLREIPLFNTLGPILLTRVAGNCESLNFRKGMNIIPEGHRCHKLFIVISGRLQLYTTIDEETELILQSFLQGDTFGEAYILDESPVFAGLRAVENSIVFSIDKQTLNSCIRENTEFSKNLSKHLACRVRDAFSRENELVKLILDSGLKLPDSYSLNNSGKNQQSTDLPTKQAPSTANPEDELDNDNVFFKKDYTCPLCLTRFQTLKPRQKNIVIVKTDEDFCIHYKTINPLYYEINVCPKCKYSFNASSYVPVKPETKNELTKMLAEIWKDIDYSGTRTLEDAIETFKTAIECQRIRGVDDSTMGKLTLKLAWLYRYLGLKPLELMNLEKALIHLTKSFEKGSVEDYKEEMNLMFLLGQLHHTFSNDTEAVNWFVRITQHPNKSNYPYIVNRARYIWQEIRQKQKREGL